MKKEIKSLVDETWTCNQCGAFNAPYLEECGRCKNKNPNLNE